VLRFFGLLGLLLHLSLPGAHPLDGGMVLLELSLRLSQGRLHLCQRGPRLGQGITRLLQLAVRRR
jgi:hypothetical protein